MITHNTYQPKLNDFQVLVLATIKDKPRRTTYDYGEMFEQHQTEDVYHAIGFLFANDFIKIDSRTGAVTARAI